MSFITFFLSFCNMVTDYPNLVSHSHFSSTLYNSTFSDTSHFYFFLLKSKTFSPDTIHHSCSIKEHSMLQEQADNNLLCDLLCQIAPSTPLTLWEQFSLLSVLLWASIVLCLHSLQWMYLNALYRTVVIDTFFCMSWLSPWSLKSVFF